MSSSKKTEIRTTANRTAPVASVGGTRWLHIRCAAPTGLLVSPVTHHETSCRKMVTPLIECCRIGSSGAAISFPATRPRQTVSISSTTAGYKAHRMIRCLLTARLLSGWRSIWTRALRRCHSRSRWPSSIDMRPSSLPREVARVPESSFRGSTRCSELEHRSWFSMLGAPWALDWTTTPDRSQDHRRRPFERCRGRCAQRRARCRGTHSMGSAPTICWPSKV